MYRTMIGTFGSIMFDLRDTISNLNQYLVISQLASVERGDQESFENLLFLHLGSASHCMELMVQRGSCRDSCD